LPLSMTQEIAEQIQRDAMILGMNPGDFMTLIYHRFRKNKVEFCDFMKKIKVDEATVWRIARDEFIEQMQDNADKECQRVLKQNDAS
jgi:hypothetical protein